MKKVYFRETAILDGEVFVTPIRKTTASALKNYIKHAPTELAMLEVLTEEGIFYIGDYSGWYQYDNKPFIRDAIEQVRKNVH